jgi:methylated-DNA-[protein]-cysteine S-methyltransferase
MDQRMAHRYHVFETRSGHCGIAWNVHGVTRFQLPAADADAARSHLLRRLRLSEPALPPPGVARIVEAAQRYFTGERIDFSDVTLDLSSQSEFCARVYQAARAVPWGSTTTYGDLAKAVGDGLQFARDVGQAMARNPVPLIIPCHRVLAAGGKLGGFSAPGGTRSKLRMLELEGLPVGAPEPGSTQRLLAW